MKAYGTYFQNDAERPLVYGEVELINPPRQRLRGEPLIEGILVEPVMIGFSFLRISRISEIILQTSLCSSTALRIAASEVSTPKTSLMRSRTRTRICLR